MTTFSHRIHPLVAIAAVSVTVLSGLGIAAITGVLPVTHGLAVDAHQTAAEPGSSPAVHPLGGSASSASTQQREPQRTLDNAPSKSVVANNAPPAQHKPAAQNSPVGIGVGALIGGVIGNQVGSGDGKTLATIAGAIGGGYIGNEVAKKNQTQP